MQMYTKVTAKCELKKDYNPFISQHNEHDLHDLYFPKGVLNTNTVNVRGKNSFNMNEP